jgi:hypothetical protein
LVRALRAVVPATCKLLVAVFQLLRDRDSAARKTPVCPRNLRHAWNFYAQWKPGEQTRRKLAVPVCALCLAELNDNNAEAACPWFVSN